jgi:hypothetical protein
VFGLCEEVLGSGARTLSLEATQARVVSEQGN